MSQAYSGVEAEAHVGANDLDAQGWTADVEVDTFDSTTTADAGWADTTSATKKVSGTIDFFYNSAKKPFTTLNMTPGTIIALVLYVNKSAGDNLAGNGLVTKMSLKTKVKDGFIVTASYVNKGVWTLPS